MSASPNPPSLGRRASERFSRNWTRTIAPRVAVGRLAGSASVFGGLIGRPLSTRSTVSRTVSARVDETFGSSNVPTPSNPLGDPARVTAAQLTAQYQLGRLWSAQASAEYDVSRYLGVSRIDDTLVTGVSVNREIARNLNVNVDYKYLSNRSTAAGSSFVNNILGASAVYKF